MDKLQDWEVYDIYESLDYSDVQQWEQTRWLGYLIAQVNCKKTLEITDLLKFKWDSNYNTSTQNISQEEITNLKHKAEEISRLLKSTSEPQMKNTHNN